MGHRWVGLGWLGVSGTDEATLAAYLKAPRQRAVAPFLAAGFGAVTIAIATTAFHAVQVARSRPVSALRYE
jgi:hypothetical protein